MRRVALLIMVLGFTVAGMAGQAIPADASGLADAAGLAGHAGRPGPATKTVRFAGYVIQVPASWPVYWLARDPHRCVRYDRHAVYLGRPGSDQQCPAHLVGRVATVSLQVPSGPAASPGARRRMGPAGMGPAGLGMAGLGMATAGPAGRRLSHVAGTITEDPAGHELRALVSNPGLAVTATYGTDGALADKVIATLAAEPGAAAGRAAAGAGGAVSSPNVRAGTIAASRRQPRPRVRRGFDTCTAPKLSTMRTWRRAFSVAAIYLGGPEAACGYGNLSPAWVRAVIKDGWALIPAYVGRQAPCTRFTLKINHVHAQAQGRAAARDAVSLARALGMGRHTPIYYDIEAYHSKKRACRNAVLSFLDGWTRELHREHYRSGVYSSAGSGAEDLGRARMVNGRRLAKPDSLWFGLWDSHANVNGLPYLLTTWWRGHHRIKQYRGNHRVRVGGVTLTIDSDLVAGAVYRLAALGGPAKLADAPRYGIGASLAPTDRQPAGVSHGSTSQRPHGLDRQPQQAPRLRLPVQ